MKKQGNIGSADFDDADEFKCCKLSPDHMINAVFGLMQSSVDNAC